GRLLLPKYEGPTDKPAEPLLDDCETCLCWARRPSTDHFMHPRTKLIRSTSPRFLAIASLRQGSSLSICRSTFSFRPRPTPLDISGVAASAAVFPAAADGPSPAARAASSRRLMSSGLNFGRSMFSVILSSLPVKVNGVL